MHFIRWRDPYIYNGQVAWLQLLWIYLVCTYMAALQYNVGLYKFSLSDLISRGFDFVWLSRSMIIIYVYQLGTGGRTQEAKPVRGVYP